jgi:hypothetical protein
MPRYDDKFVDRFLEPWNRHDVEKQVVGGELRLRAASSRVPGAAVILGAARERETTNSRRICC